MVHSFWAYELGVKADANPGVDNIAFVKPSKLGTFQIRCAELCGLWHGYMFDTGKVVTASQFATWIKGQRAFFAPIKKYLPAYSTTYDPDPQLPRRMSLSRVLRFNLLTAVVLGVGGYFLGWWLGHQITSPSIDYFGDTGQNDIALFVAYFVGVVGFLVGLGFLNYPVQRMLGHPPSLREKESAGMSRYFALCTDHKVVGIQYLIGIGAFRLHRRAERDAHPVRAPAPDAPGVERQQLPDARRDPRHDDDGNDDERHPRAVRQLSGAADDRVAPHGLPADRGAHVLAADGRRARSS